MKGFTLILFLCYALSTSGQQKKVVSVGYLEAYDQLQKIKFEQSNQAEFDQIEPAKKVSKPLLKPSKTHHLIPTKEKLFQLKKYKDYGLAGGFSGYEYLGYYSNLKIYALSDNSTSENLGFGTMVLFDSITAYQYQIISIGDGAVETPIASPNGKYFLYFYNWVYDPNSCFIGLLKVGDRKHPQKFLREYSSFETKNWAVEKIKWIDDQTFIVKAFKIDKANGRTKSFHYFKSKIE